MVGVPAEWGTVGLTVSAGVAGWVEFLLLRRALRRRLGPVTISASLIGRAWLIALLAAGGATACRWMLPSAGNVLRGLVILGVFGVLYLAGAQLAGLLDVTTLARRVLRRR